MSKQKYIINLKVEKVLGNNKKTTIYEVVNLNTKTLLKFILTLPFTLDLEKKEQDA